MDHGNDVDMKINFQKHYSEGYSTDSVKCSQCVKNKSEAQAEIARLTSLLNDLRKVS